MRYYIKRCGAQELGSVKATGKPQRGRYLLTSMNSEVLSFFPPLSQTQKNDYSMVCCIPLYLNTKVYCRFVYHNDKYHHSTAAHPRNEHRLYINLDLEGGALLFKTGDILVFRKKDENEPNSELLLDYIPMSNGTEYKFYKKLIDDSDIKGGYAVCNGVIEFFENKVDARLQTQSVTIDPALIKALDTDKNSNDKVAGLFNQVMFRDFLLVGYEELCAITRTVIRYDNFMNIEAAHIRPKAQGGEFLPSNGLMLSRDLHWAFDKGFFSITDELKVMVHPKAKSEFLNSFNGTKLFIPRDSFFQPNIENVKWHRKHLYGLFLTSGAIREVVGQ